LQPTKSRKWTAGLILTARLTYSLQWFVLSPALAQVAFEGSVPTSLLGLVTVAFFAAAGVAQVPSIYVVRKIGAKKTYILGLLLLAGGNMLLPINASTPSLFGTRMLSGVGAAMFFASAGGVLSRLYPTKPGLVMGLYNVAFALGGGLGLAWGVLHQLLGWRLAMELGGLTAIVLALINLVAVEEQDVREPRTIGLPNILKNKAVAAAGLSYVGVWGTYFAVGQLLPAYEQIALGESVSLSGLTSSLLLFPSIAGGLLSFLYDRARSKRLLLAAVAVPAVVPAVAISAGRIDVIVVALIVLGFFNEMSMSMIYAYVVGLPGSEPTATLALVNTFHMLIGMWLAPMVSLASTVSWSLGWILVGTLPLMPLVLLLIVKPKASDSQSHLSSGFEAGGARKSVH
jgi:MFS family permease